MSTSNASGGAGQDEMDQGGMDGGLGLACAHQLLAAERRVLCKMLELLAIEWEREDDEKADTQEMRNHLRALVQNGEVEVKTMADRLDDATLLLASQDRKAEKAKALRAEAQRLREHAPTDVDSSDSPSPSGSSSASDESHTDWTKRARAKHKRNKSKAKKRRSKAGKKHRNALRTGLKERAFGLSTKQRSKIRKAIDRKAPDTSGTSESSSPNAMSCSDASFVRSLAKTKKRGVDKTDLLQSFSKAVSEKKKKFDAPRDLWKLMERRLRKAGTEKKRKRRMAYFKVLWDVLANYGIAAARACNNASWRL